MRGGYYTFKTNYVSPFPIPSFETLDKILIDNVEKLVSELIDDNKQLSKEEIIDIMKCIDCIIYKIYSLSDEDIVTIGKCTNQ